MTLTIRQAQVEDVESLARLHVDAWHRTYADIIPKIEEMGFTLESQRENWGEMLSQQQRGEITLLAFEDGVLAGFICAGPAQEERPISQAEIYALYVDYARHKKGIGAALMKAAFDALAERGYSTVALWVLADNPACGFYDRLGGKVADSRTRERLGKQLIRLGYLWDGGKA